MTSSVRHSEEAEIDRAQIFAVFVLDVYFTITGTKLHLHVAFALFLPDPLHSCWDE